MRIPVTTERSTNSMMALRLMLMDLCSRASRSSRSLILRKSIFSVLPERFRTYLSSGFLKSLSSMDGSYRSIYFIIKRKE